MSEKVDVSVINKFDGQNYKQWKFQIKCALRAKGVLEVAVGESVQPSSTNLKDLENWNRKDAIAIFTITSTMDLSLITLIENCSSAHQVFEKLDTIYDQKSETNKMMHQERYHKYKMDKNDTIAMHVAKIENLAKEVRNAGDTISDTAIMTKILSGLPEKYRNLRQAWLSVEESKQTIQNLTARLLDEEANLKTSEDCDNAFVTQAKKGSKAKGSKPPITCYNCQKKGHFARYCRAPKKSRPIGNPIKENGEGSRKFIGVLNRTRAKQRSTNNLGRY